MVNLILVPAIHQGFPSKTYGGLGLIHDNCVNYLSQMEFFLVQYKTRSLAITEKLHNDAYCLRTFLH